MDNRPWLWTGTTVRYGDKWSYFHSIGRKGYVDPDWLSFTSGLQTPNLKQGFWICSDDPSLHEHNAEAKLYGYGWVKCSSLRSN